MKRGFDQKNVHAPITLKSGDKVLEAGTGSGIWLLDLSTEVPNDVEMQGIDIEPRIFPAPETCSNNIQFSVHSVTSLPQAWTDRFTLVHQRLLVASLQEVQWRNAINEMYRVTAPGGWIQLFEPSEWHAGPVNTRHRALITALSHHRGIIWDCYKYIPQMLADAGFVDLKVIQKELPLGKWGGEDGVAHRKNLIEVWWGTKTPILKAGGFGFVNSEQEFDQLMIDLETEWDDTLGSACTWITWCARKPL
ncbi:S-adenosyl-L-methionine-dependent methyltransferase [Crucibulum laeve]|uniref:S-adenosyl-L-methionine-dependent methyltransferase n=1 Tax=Crucibulum laeve TaxID=68775 RepID=A0A5C3M2N2_9AGAR|nr:S-adenosyl-L-methionine-dependent methyltransferase [Crucibulum laeve]